MNRAVSFLGGILALPSMLAAADIAQVAMFAYDASAPLAVEELSVVTNDIFSQREITFVGDPRGDEPSTVTATLLLPVSAPGRPAPGILWVHWLGEPETTNRTEFLDEARAWADRGVVSLLVDTMWAKPGWYRNRVLAEDRANHIRQVVELCRALDLLAAQPHVDPARLALVGHDYGAMHGLIAAAFDDRVRTCVFIAAAPSMLDWAFYLQQPADPAAYRAAMAPLELTDFAPDLAGRPVLLQFAREDFYVPRPRAEALFGALAEPRRMEVYDGAGHEMNAPPSIRADRTAWLEHHLQPAGIP